MKKVLLYISLIIFPALTWGAQNAPIQVQASTTYNLTYELYGGTNHANNPTSYTDADEDFDLLPATKANLRFQGWYKSEGFNEFDRVDTLPGNHAGVTKLYAKWGIITYTVDFETNGGGAISQKFANPKYTTGLTATALQTPNTIGGYASISRDLNGDGYGDYIGFRHGNRHVYMSNGNGGFTYTYQPNNLHSDSLWFAKFIDINDDDLEDLISVSESSALTYSLRQPDGSLGTETLFTLASGGAQDFAPIHFDMADIDGDGLLDIAMAVAGRIIYRLRTGTFSFGPAVAVSSVSNYGRGVRMADFNQDGHLDIFGASDYSSFVKFGDGITPFGGTLVDPVRPTYRGFLSDVDRDSKPEIIGLATYTTIPSSLGFNNDLTLEDRVNMNETPLATANWHGDEMDMNGDGFNDLFYVMSNSNSGMIFSQGGNGYETTRVTNMNLSRGTGTVVYNPAFGTFGLMGTSTNTPLTLYTEVVSNQMSVSHLASTVPTRAGYTFAGWYDNEDLLGTPFNFNNPVTSNITLYAKWSLNTFPVTYQLNGGTNAGSNPTVVSIESPAYTLADPTKTGSRFEGWYATSDFSGSPITTIPANATQAYSLYAKWLDPISVNFIVNGGSDISTINDLPGEVFNAPTQPTRAGYTFNGWFTNAELTNPYTFSVFPSQNLTLYAKWTALSFTITFESNGGTAVASITRNTDQALSLPANPTRTGYTFDGWFSNIELTNRFTNTTMPPNSVTLYAKWNLNAFAVTYVLNGGTNAGSNPATVSIESPLITLADPTKAGSRFLGWYQTSDFSGSPITTIPANSTQTYTLYAKWLDPISVTFVSNGGSTVTTINDLPGEVFSAPTSPTRAGYTFVGWFTDTQLTNAYTFTVIPSQNLTVYAKWNALSFTITFETNGGNTLPSQSFNTDQTLNLPSSPTRVGYTFDGWFTNAGLTSRFTNTTMPPNNVTLYAKWLINSHTLTWVVNGRNYQQTVVFDTLIENLLPVPTKYQHEFLGWAASGSTLINLSTYKMPDQAVTLTAIFRDNVNPVVFTLTNGDTYELGIDIVFNEGSATLNGQSIQSGHRVLLPGEYELIVTDGAGNSTTVSFTVIASRNNIQWIVFASVLTLSWLILAILYYLNRNYKGGDSNGGGTLVMTRTKVKPTPKPKREVKVVKEKSVQVIQQTPVQTPSTPAQAKTLETPLPPPVPVVKEPAKVKLTEPVIIPPVNEAELEQTVIFEKPLKIKADPIETFTPEVKQTFNEVFVSDQRKVVVPELPYLPNTTNVPFYTNLFRYIHRFANVLTSDLLGSLTQAVTKLTTDEKTQLKIVEASTRVAERMPKQKNQDYFLKLLRRNVALNRDVLNPRNKYVYSYQRLATLLEELGIYLEAVILVREAYERGLYDSPEATFEKRLTRLEKKLVESDGKRQDMIRK